MTVALRAATADDEPFIEQLLTSTLAEELMAWMWPEPMREQLLSMQYRGRRQQVPETAEIRIVVVDGKDAGWVVVNRLADYIDLADIALLNDQRGKGTGSAVLGVVVGEADAEGLPVHLHVLATNRAAHLYERLGFEKTGGDEVNWEMRRPVGGRPV